MNQVSLNYDTIFSKGAKISFQKFDSLELKDKDLEELELTIVPTTFPTTIGRRW